MGRNKFGPQRGPWADEEWKGTVSGRLHGGCTGSAERSRRVEGSQRKSSNPGLIKGRLHLANPNRAVTVAVVLNGPVHPLSCYLFSRQIHAQAIRQLPFEKLFYVSFAPKCARLAEWCFGNDLRIIIEIVDDGAELSALPCLFKKKGSEKLRLHSLRRSGGRYQANSAHTAPPDVPLKPTIW